jgi:cobalt/nickel transport system permease protein
LAVLAAGIIVSLTANNAAVYIFTIAAMNTVNITVGGIKPSNLLKTFAAPTGFLLLACLTTAVDRAGITAASLTASVTILLRALAVLSCVFFFVLNTPITDISFALVKLRTPPLLLELTELTYRFIFVLSGAAASIRLAQTARLGYVNRQTSLRSTAILASAVFLKALRRSERISRALESRGGNGTIATASQPYESGRQILLIGAAVLAGQLLIWVLFSFVFKT